MAARFVMRAMVLSSVALTEALSYGDTLYVRGDPNAIWGPLQSLTRWFECAVTGWPNAQLIGKADDDIWAHLPDIAASLASAQALSRTAKMDGLLWGLIEAAAWNEAARLPAGFHNAHVLSGAMSSCNTTKSQKQLPHGPFP